MGAGPAPRNILKELISGGSTAKFTTMTSDGSVARNYEEPEARTIDETGSYLGPSSNIQEVDR
jgi:hypothetical protein